MAATSIKGVLFDRAGRVLLCRNDRGEWELPGGRPERDEGDAACLRREIWEETGLDVEVAALLSTYRFEVLPGRKVDIRAYGCRMVGPDADLVRSEEHTELAFVSAEALEKVELPIGYREAVVMWRSRSQRI